MNKVKKPTFIVDLSETMIVSSLGDGNEDKQKLFCNCGHSQEYNSKIMRNVVKNYDELTEDSESLQSITCKSCGSEYNYNKKVYLLSPNKDELYHINYSIEDIGDKRFVVKKSKNYANYNSSKDTIKYKEVIDYVEFNLKTKKVKASINGPFEKSESLHPLSKDGNTFNENVDITNVSVYEEFFFFVDSVKYTGLESAYEALEKIKPEIKDLSKFEHVRFLYFLSKNNEIIKEHDENGDLVYFQFVDSGFGDGQKMKRKLISGDYLFNLLNCYKLFTSVVTFEYSSTIIITKEFEFFKKWIQSKYICKPEVYKKHNATNPNSILEVSMRYNAKGDIRDVFKKDGELDFELENDGVLKISSTIYNAINYISNLDVLNDVYSEGVLKKSEIESLLQKYESKRLYSVLSKFVSNNKRNRGETLELKHLEHIMKNGIDQAEKQSDYITVYADTIRVINLLELKDKVLFKCKDYAAIKELHDDYTARFNAMKDAKKAELFVKSVEPFLKFNSTIGDIEFEVVPTTERLNLEGLQMHHCIYTYLNRICERHYVAINVNHKLSKERATAGFVRKGDKLEFEQLKGFYNSRASAEIINATIEFCNMNKFKVSNSNYDLQPDSSRQNFMPGQLNEQELAELREKLAKENPDYKNVNKTEKKEGKKGFFQNLF
jgi:hypothetical protein